MFITSAVYSADVLGGSTAAWVLGAPQGTPPCASLRAVDAPTAAFQTRFLFARPPAWNARLAEIQVGEGALALGVLGVFVALIGSHLRVQKYIRDAAGVKESASMTISGQPIEFTRSKEFVTQKAHDEFVNETKRKIARIEEHIIPRAELLARFRDLETAGAERLKAITDRLDRIAATEGQTAAAFEQFQRDLPNLIRNAK
jgi:hypothetical protein